MKNDFMKKEWEPQEGMMPALSVSQPFERAFFLGIKKIELRTWPTSYRGDIALHAPLAWFNGVRFDKGKATKYEVLEIKEIVTRLKLPVYPREYPIGAITAVMRLVHCARFTEASWERLRAEHCRTGAWDRDAIGWQFTDIRVLPEPILNVRGYPGLFAVESAPILERLCSGVKDGYKRA